MLFFKLIELMDKFKKTFLFLLELEEQTHVHFYQKISKMVNMKNSMVHTNLKLWLAAGCEAKVAAEAPIPYQRQ